MGLPRVLLLLAQVCALTCHLVASQPLLQEDAWIEREGAGALNAAVKAQVAISNKPTKSKAAGKTGRIVTSQPPPPKALSKKTPPPPPSKKTPPPPPSKKTPPPPPKKTLSPPPTNLPFAAARFHNLLSFLAKKGVFSQYIDTAIKTQFDLFIGTRDIYSLTFFVTDNNVWSKVKSTKANVRLQVLQYNTIYSYYNKTTLDSDKAGGKYITTDNTLPMFKVSNDRFFNKAGANAGIHITTGDFYVDLNATHGNWIAHRVSDILPPPKLF